MTQPAIALTITDTLRREGLHRLLSLVSDCTVAEVSPAAPPEAEPSLWIIDTDALVTFSTFFNMRRKSTAIISPTPSDSFFHLDPTLPVDTLAASLHGILASLSPAETASGSLSPREIDVLRLVARGFINKEIADRLSISINTVLTHRKNITAKLGIRSASGLGISAVMNGYLDESEL